MTDKAPHNNLSHESVYHEGNETIENLGRFRLIQNRSGYRYSVDSLLLSRFVLPIRKGERVIDIGTGSGVIPLFLLQYEEWTCR